MLKSITGVAVLLLTVVLCAEAQTNHFVDAAAPVPEPRSGYIKVDSNVAPNGDVLDVNSWYFTLNGKPWMPMMGEFQFARYPHDRWDEELEKMKLSGIDVVATYLFWNYHEETPGEFNWEGDCNLRRFVKLADKHGLKVWLRIGPWVHGEVRYGGLPDWIVRLVPTRCSDPVYMKYVERYWTETAKQLEGLFWKDGGPIIGLQPDNEYNLTGHLQGRKHMADLKALMQKLGFKTPFYTATGWDHSVYPQHEFIPTWGNYVDWPWADSLERQPPRDSYTFKFREKYDEGNMGAQTEAAEKWGDAFRDAPHVPFCGVEFGTGIPAMYWRRPIISGDDGAAMLPVYIGSGVNLYGYYVYHGGRNTIGQTTRQGSTLVGDWVDNPIISYDFQAAFGQYGEPSAAVERIRPIHYLINSFGDRLAPMTTRQPETIPDGDDDLETLRWTVRAKDDSAFLFVNNHVRHYPMPDHENVQFSVKLPGKTVTLPASPVKIRTGKYFIWPIGFGLDNQKLEWASAQPITRISNSAGTYYVFMSNNGIAPEFAFASGTRVEGPSVVINEVDGLTVASGIEPGLGTQLIVTAPDGGIDKLLVLNQEQGRRLFLAEFGCEKRLVITDDELVRSGNSLQFTSINSPGFAFAVWPALPDAVNSSLKLEPGAKVGLFKNYMAKAVAHSPQVKLAPIREAQPMPPAVINPRTKNAFQPFPEQFGKSAAWNIELGPDAFKGLDDVFMVIDWDGDISRLFAAEELIDDMFFYGADWRIGLSRFKEVLNQPLTLTILPLRSDAPLYIDETVMPDFGGEEQVARINSIRLEPQYRLIIRPPSK